MVDENKVILMTKLEIYEKSEQGRDLNISKFYKRDYVRYNVLKTWIASTVVFWLGIGVYLFMNFETLLMKIDEIDYFDMIYKALAMYVLFCAIYFGIASLLYIYRYEKAKPGLVKYNSNLKRLIELEGGQIRKAKVLEDSSIAPAQEKTEVVSKDRTKKPVISRTDLIKQKEVEEESKRKQEIIENAKLRNERINLQKEEQLREQKRKQEELKRLQERRRQIEQMQIERAKQSIDKTIQEHVDKGGRK